MTRYDALAAIAQRELDLITGGDVDRLPALHAERDALIAGLPDVPPPAARPALERTAKLQSAVEALLEERLQETSGELRRLTKGRTAMRGYAPSVEPLKLVDRAG
jgi:hypothetical protein